MYSSYTFFWYRNPLDRKSHNNKRKRFKIVLKKDVVYPHFFAHHVGNLKEDVILKSHSPFPALKMYYRFLSFSLFMFVYICIFNLVYGVESLYDYIMLALSSKLNR